MQEPKGKAASKPTTSSKSGSSTHQGVEPSNVRGGKRKPAKDSQETKAASDEHTSKRTRVGHGQLTEPAQSISRKRTRQNHIPDSPIVEVEEEQDASDDSVVKRTRHVENLPQEEHKYGKSPLEEHTFSYAHINTTPSDASQIAQQQRLQTPPTRLEEIVEEPAINGTTTPSASEQPILENINAKNSERRSDTEDASQEQLAQRTRSESFPPLPTLKHPQPPIRASASPNDAFIMGQGLSNTRVAQGSARDASESIPSDPAEKEAYLQKRFGKHRSKVLEPHTKAVLSMGPNEIFDDSEHEEDIQNPFTSREEFREWKSDLRVAQKTLNRVMGGERLPSPEPSSKGKAKQIASSSMEHSQRDSLTILQSRRKLGETPPASRPSMNIFKSNTLIFPASSSQAQIVVTDPKLIDTLRSIVEWTQSSETNSLPSKERFIGLLEASKSEEMTRARPSAPSPASQQASSQPASARSVRHNEKQHSAQDNQSPAVGVHPSGVKLSNHHREIEHPAEDGESDALGYKSSDDEAKDDTMSDSQSEVDANEAAPTTPIQIQTLSQQAPEPRGVWSVLSTVKNVVASPFKFFGRNQNAGGAATTNSNETEFTFTHPHKFSQPPTTPTRSKKQRAKPQSERRRTSNSSRASQSARVPQTERQRRHADKSKPLHMRGAPSESDLKDLREEQASTRRRQREAETANFEPSHGKTFKVPDSDTTDSDDGDGDDENQEQEPEEAEITNSKPKTWAFLTQSKPVLEASAQAEQSPPKKKLPWDGEDWAWVADAARAEEAKKRKQNAFRPQTQSLFANKTKIHDFQPFPNMPLPPEKDTSTGADDPYRYELFAPYNYRRINMNDEHDICYTMFGEEASFKKMQDGSFRKMETPQDYFKGNTWFKVQLWNKNAKNREWERNTIEKKWASMPQSRREALGYKGPASNGSSSAQTATPSGTYKAPSDSGSDNERDDDGNNVSAAGDNFTKPVGDFTSRMQEIEKTAESSTNTNKGSADENTSAQSVQDTGSALQQKQWNQTPPPKPRPSNAQLPQPSPAEIALANANKYKPTKPSGLRNVTPMSPLQVEQENRAQEEKELREVDEALDNPKIAGYYPRVFVPAPLLEPFDVPEDMDGTYEEVSQEIEDAVNKAWAQMHPGNPF